MGSATPCTGSDSCQALSRVDFGKWARDHPNVESEETVGERIGRLRRERGLSLRDLASAGVEYSYLWRIENGQRVPSRRVLTRLAPTLGVTADYLETGRGITDGDRRRMRLAGAELAMRLDAQPARLESELRELLAEASRAGDVEAMQRSIADLGILAASQGENQKAIRRLERAVAYPEMSVLVQPEVYLTLARAYADTGAGQQAVDLLRRCLDQVGASDPGLRIRLVAELSYALSDSGRALEAHRLLTQEEAQAAVADPYSRVRIHWARARLALLEGDHAIALAATRKASALLEATDDTIHLGRAFLLRASILLGSGAELEEVDEALASAVSLLGHSGEAIDRGDILILRARLLARRGEAEGAVELAEEALAIFRGQDRLFEGRAQLALGEALTSARRTLEAGFALERARQLLAGQRQMLAEVERASAALAELCDRDAAPR
jgi:transcriptional regulator with XRE-family HTH domain